MLIFLDKAQVEEEILQRHALLLKHRQHAPHAPTHGPTHVQGRGCQGYNFAAPSAAKESLWIPSIYVTCWHCYLMGVRLN